MKTVLVLGAGLVARPAVRYLLDTGRIKVVLADQVVGKAEAIIAGHANGEALHLEAGAQELLSVQISQADTVVSLLPWTMHLNIAQLCLKHAKHMVTASYIKDDMQALDGDARAKGLVFLNEVGVDPGLDHMSAMQIFDQAKSAGGRIDSFYSYCGGLPAPRHNNNPLGYKFSWSPEGVMLAAGNEGRYLKNGETIKVPGQDLFRHYWLKHIPGAGVFEAYVNRDSIPYLEIYGLDQAHSIYRGTLRYIGHCETWDRIKQIGLLDQSKTYDWDKVSPKKAMAGLMGCREGDLKEFLASYLQVPAYSLIIKKLEWLGLLSDGMLNLGSATVFDMFAHILQERLVYEEGEADQLVMHHEFEVSYPEQPAVKIQSTMIDVGRPGGDSAMSRTVGYPVGIAARLVAEEEISLSGVLRPVASQIYAPILHECQEIGIRFQENRSPVTQGTVSK